MLPSIALSTFLPILFAITIGLANPINVDRDIFARDNTYNLKCSNAPAITAGDLVSQSDVVLSPVLPPSGSDAPWFKYLYCTPGTKTYTFFNIAEMNPVPGVMSPPGYHNVYEAFKQATVAINALAQNDGPIAGGAWTLNASDTNIQISVVNQKGKLTYGILGAAFTGLTLASANYNPQENPMIFQINDGQWGEVGIGYAGYLNSVGQCIVIENATASYACNSATHGFIGGFF